MANLHIQRNIEEAANGIRRRVLEHTVKNDGGYLSQACSSAEILAALYLGLMNLGPMGEPLEPHPFPGVPSGDNPSYILGHQFNGPRAPELDRFILSPTHYSLVLYATLIEAGRMTPSGLDHFNQDGSSVEMIGAEHSPGMEVMTGSLGQGLSQAAGMAMGRRRKGETGFIWVMMSDGEFQIGQTWEALQFLSHHALDTIRIYVDVNRQQCDGTVASVMSIEPLADRIRAFGGTVVTLEDGHHIPSLLEAAATPHRGRPLVVLCYTDPCRGVEPLRANIPKLHYLRFRSPEEKVRYEAWLNREMT